MKPSLQHEIIVGLIVFFLGLAIVKGYSWITNLINSWDDRRALKSLQEMESNPALYADKSVRRQRLMLGLAGYLLGCYLVTNQLFGDTKFLNILLGIGVVGCALVGGMSGSTSTEIGVRELCKVRRKRLVDAGKLPAAMQQRKRAAGNG